MVGPEPKTFIFCMVLLEKNDMRGRQQSLTGVLPHPYHTLGSLQQLWFANSSLASTSINHFGTEAQVLESGLSLRRSFVACMVLLEKNDM